MLNFTEWLTDNYHNLIVVDIQPAYSNSIRFKNEFFSYLKNAVSKNKKIIYFYNGESLGFDDNPDLIIQWLIEDEYSDDEDMESLYSSLKRNIIWFDKGYGFFRAWMDEGVEDSVIIKVIRYMVSKRINDSRDIEEEVLEYLTGGNYPQHDPLYMPDISLGTLKQFAGSYMCGGGENECLKEVRILMNAFNINYTLLSRFIY